ncbi:hypothetical protein Pfo_011360, partial [Paulownia fortunei]
MSQDRVFYSGEWTKEVDKKFIQELVQQTSLGHFKVGGQNTHVILSAMGVANQQFQTNFDYVYCVARMKKLYKHYRVFNWIRNLSGVNYNPLTHLVQCHQDLWECIYREKKLAMTYILKDEIEFDAQKCIFQDETSFESGPDDNEIIENSSDHDVDGGGDDEGHNINDIGGYEFSEDNTDNSFWNEIAWNPSDSTSDASLFEMYDPILIMSSNVNKRNELNLVHDEVGSGRRYPSADPPSSSIASNSPWKKFEMFGIINSIMKKGLMLKYMGQMWRMSIWMTKCLMVRFQEKTKLVQMMNHLLVLKMDLELKI